MKKVILLGVFIALLNEGNAQAYSGPVLRMGTEMTLPTLQGTARFVGSGGVMGSVGGDISNLNTNPAGLGMFSRSELEITPTMSINNANSNYLLNDGTGGQYKTNFDNNRYKFTLNSAGVVFANRRSESASLRASNVTIGINRTADFNRTVNFGMGANRVYSYSNYLANEATYINNYGGGMPNPPLSEDYSALANVYNQALMAANTELIYYDNAGGYYADPVDITKVNVSQFGQQKTTGGVTELSFAWSGNISDRYYIGVSLGIPFLNYQTDFVFSEDNRGTSTHPNSSFYGQYKSFDMTEIDKYTGAGVNLKLGGLVKLNDEIKLSAYIHTPTFMEVTNDYYITMTTNFEKNRKTRDQSVDDFQFSYFTPFKFGGGLSYMLGKKGFIGMEYEFNNLDNLTIDVKNEPQFTNNLNNALRLQNQNVHTLKLGMELVLPSIGNGDEKSSPFRLRLGYNYRTSPKEPNMVLEQGDRITHTFTGGLGYRGKTVSLDLAYMRSQFRDYRDLYVYNDMIYAGVSSWNSINQVSATVNFRFK